MCLRVRYVIVAVSLLMSSPIAFAETAAQPSAEQRVQCLSLLWAAYATRSTDMQRQLQTTLDEAGKPLSEKSASEQISTLLQPKSFVSERKPFDPPAHSAAGSTYGTARIGAALNPARIMLLAKKARVLEKKWTTYLNADPSQIADMQKLRIELIELCGQDAVFQAEKMCGNEGLTEKK